MPRRAVPEHVLRAIGAHLLEAHGIEELDPGEIGAPTARRNTITVTWQNDPEQGAFIRCRRCQPGRDRYYTEVDAPEPSPRLLALIRDHFAREYAIAELAAEAIYHQGNTTTEERLATFMPATPHIGASIICKPCEGRIYFNLAYYGDARWTALTLSHNPELWTETRGLSPAEQAEYVEAWGRGELQKAAHKRAHRALSQARAQRQTRERDPLEAALQRHMLEQTGAGRGITEVANELLRLSTAEPVEFTILVGRQIPVLAELEELKPPEAFARDVVEFLRLPKGSWPSIKKRKLWDLWNEVKGD